MSNPLAVQTMDALRLHTFNDPAGLKVERIPKPHPVADDVLIQVYAAALTRDELKWSVDRLPATPSYELSGVVAELGPDATGCKVDDEVYALTAFDRDGAAAEYALVRASYLAPKPRTLGHVESAAVPLAALTAWQALLVHGGLKPGQRVLIHGASGGVGSFATQLAHAHGAHVLATASGGGVEVAQQLGADEVIEHHKERFEDKVGEVDLVFDTVGGDNFERSLAVIRRGGTFVTIAEEPEKKRAEARGVRAVYFVVEPNHDQLLEITQRVEQHTLKPHVAEVFSVAQGRQAFETTLHGHPGGKVVLRVVS